ncbi:hypothetical protein MKW98_021276 [Papaver atlanticum]|uniref:protein-synthesizing GTPase n=1 Tax=Papaver atlanticum TaxID=357466 RepID=A0AAD4XJ36_9MAGN|nr:hypothetical protein MKW98_021276 [Papaver atlanticum]
MARKGLMEQDLSKLDVTKLHPLSPEVISRQVAHGKSTVVKAISGIQTVRFNNEVERNITIKLGYANAKIYKCEDERCPAPMCYKAYGSGKEDTPSCDVPGHVSFVDCPGHDMLMATMLNGAAIMDRALLLIAANESIPKPQTLEHLDALDNMLLEHIIVLQNKVDLIPKNVALEQHESIQKLIQKTVAAGAPIVPISAQLKYNIDVVCEYLVNKIPIPKRNFISPPNMIIIRSFDVNKPGSEVDELLGVVAGGSIVRGVLKVNQLVEVRPGMVLKDENGTSWAGNLNRWSGLARYNLHRVHTASTYAKLQLTSPVCTSIGEKLALSRRVDRHWRLIGRGQIQEGITLEVPLPCSCCIPIGVTSVKRCC